MNIAFDLALMGNPSKKPRPEKLSIKKTDKPAENQVIGEKTDGEKNVPTTEAKIPEPPKAPPSTEAKIPEPPIAPKPPKMMLKDIKGILPKQN